MLLNPSQLEDFERIRISLVKINELRIRVNALAAANGFACKMTLPELGQVAHRLEGVSFEHQRAEAVQAARQA